MADIVLIHGAYHGGWCWRDVAETLRREGHRVFTPSLTGLGDRHHLVDPDVNLDTHIADIRNLIEAEELHDVVLVGHSYGGAVITEAGDLPNVAGLVYIAAFAPDAGESPGGITAGLPPAAIANVAPDSDGYLWIKPDKFHESFCQDLPVGAETSQPGDNRRDSVSGRIHQRFRRDRMTDTIVKRHDRCLSDRVHTGAAGQTERRNRFGVPGRALYEKDTIFGDGTDLDGASQPVVIGFLDPAVRHLAAALEPRPPIMPMSYYQA